MSLAMLAAIGAAVEEAVKLGHVLQENAAAHEALLVKHMLPTPSDAEVKSWDRDRAEILGPSARAAGDTSPLQAGDSEPPDTEPGPVTRSKR